MEYSINKLAKLSGVSVRTLHYYDEIGLLKPKRGKWNNYRSYNEEDLLLLQQILFYKELDFSLDQIRKIIKDKNFNFVSALRTHRNEITKKKKRIDDLLKTIDKTILRITKNKHMNDDQLFDSLIKKHEKEYAKEAKDRWGSTEACKESQRRVSRMSKDELKKVLQKQGEISKEIAECMKEGLGVKSQKVQELVKRHYNWLKNFYDPSPEIYLGLAKMYVDDPRFKKNYEDIEAGLAQYLSNAMEEFVRTSL